MIHSPHHRVSPSPHFFVLKESANFFMDGTSFLMRPSTLCTKVLKVRLECFVVPPYDSRLTFYD